MKTSLCIAVAVVAGILIGGVAVQGLHAQAKPPVYLIAQNEVSDVDAYLKEYSAKRQASAKAAGGRYLVLGGKVTPLDGPPPKTRTVILAWDSLEKLQAWYNSPEAKALREVGKKYATFHVFAVEGVAQQ
jgi:uncharacterized protein (DUF1330 family)